MTTLLIKFGEGTFHKPENYDKIRTLENGNDLWAGANDWECGFTWAWITEHGQKEPLDWTRIDHAKCPGCHGNQETMPARDESKCIDYGKAAVDKWAASTNFADINLYTAPMRTLFSERTRRAEAFLERFAEPPGFVVTFAERYIKRGQPVPAGMKLVREGPQKKGGYYERDASAKKTTSVGKKTKNAVAKKPKTSTINKKLFIDGLTKLDIGGFEPVKSNEDAVKYAKEKLGVNLTSRATVSVGYTNSVLAGLSTFKKQGYKMPDDVVLTTGHNLQFFAGMVDSGVQRTVLRLPQTGFTNFFNMTKDQLNDKGMGAENDPMYVFVHEMGHVIHGHKDTVLGGKHGRAVLLPMLVAGGIGGSWAGGAAAAGLAVGSGGSMAAVGAGVVAGAVVARKIFDYLSTFKQPSGWAQCRKEISGDVTPYAMTHPNEFVAEVFAGQYLGRKFRPKTLEWYKHFGGTMPRDKS